MNTLRLSSVVLFAALATSPAMAQWSNSTLPSGQVFNAATSVGSKALFAGGERVHTYDASTATWTSVPLSARRSGVAATTVGPLAMFGGGTYPGSAPADVVDIYDNSTDSWTVATLPTAIGATVATTVGTKAIFSNGVQIDIYDHATGTWSSDVSPYGGYGGGDWVWHSVSVGNKAVFATGRSVTIYDVTSGAWSNTFPPSAPSWLSGYALGTVGTKVFIAGGISVSWPLDTVHIYDDATGLWTTTQLSVWGVRSAATTVGNKVMFGGGDYNGPGGAVDIYDDATGIWSVARLSEARLGVAATTIGARALFAGGIVTSPSGPSSVLDIYDDSIGAAYCTPAAVNSTGSSATLHVQGFPGSAAQDSVIMTVAQLPPGTVGYLLNSMSQGSTPNPGGSQGTLCLSGSIGRSAADAFSADPGGDATLRLDLRSTPTASGPISVMAGETWNYQAWYRDANPLPTSNFTSAVTVTFR